MSLPNGIVARFKLHYRCLNCERNIFRSLDVPDEAEAPRDVDELLESAFFQNQRYFCATCESSIGTLIAVQQWRSEEAAA
jgi:DNA-directed RNA polymerase subunit RPC12/RpoP